MAVISLVMLARDLISLEFLLNKTVLVLESTTMAETAVRVPENLACPSLISGMVGLLTGKLSREISPPIWVLLPLAGNLRKEKFLSGEKYTVEKNNNKTPASIMPKDDKKSDNLLGISKN
ncbi:MAG: hypothetical protein A2534_03515 [Candidatus Magasanikbacteria bacterium RIFOXYD2_FULL_39_9]|nr:MAG: hypothetical protein A2534_03515 [Candidatus Magasanikbacteria bacterium RIFOXYD2_FULL_39_9]